MIKVQAKDSNIDVLVAKN